jgi:hypothetical protein
MHSGNNADVVKLSLDELLFTEFDRGQEPGEVLATDSLFFRQKSTTRQVIQWAEYSNVGEFEEHAERQMLNETDVVTDNKTTATIRKWIKSIPISSEFFADDQHDETRQTIKNVGMRGRQTQDHQAFAKTYADGFDGNIFTTPDGQALFSNSHTNLNGDTIDNLETGTLTPDNLKTAVTSLRLQKAQDGEYGGHNVAGLLVPVTLHDEALEITKSALVANSAENNLNYFSEIYPGLVCGASAFLDSAFNTATNADTSYYLASRNHQVSRYTREGMSTDLIEPRFSKTDEWEYRARFREISVPQTWEGVVASNGTV